MRWNWLGIFSARKCKASSYDEGEFWRYVKTHWEAIPQHELSLMVQKLSGLTYSENRMKVRISKSRAAGILGFLADNPNAARLLRARCSRDQRCKLLHRLS
jgi:hypothetical protein